MNPSDGWKPSLPGWSSDILPFYEAMADEIPNGGTCVELGVWCGRSLCYLHDALARRDKQCSLVGVDLWPNGYGFGGFDEAMAASHGVFTWSIAQMLREAPEHMRDLRLLRWESDTAARLFEDQSVDMLFVDAMHDYEHVLADLRAWTPKVARTGILAGHDFDPVNYPGVVRAAQEMYGADRIVLPIDNGTVWRVRR
jgi:hypothetical protein